MDKSDETCLKLQKRILGQRSVFLAKLRPMSKFGCVTNLGQLTLFRKQQLDGKQARVMTLRRHHHSKFNL